jgi:hypothetical protein
LFEQGFRADYPCADCPGEVALDLVSHDAWDLFCAAASRSTVTVKGVEREVFEVNAEWVRLLIETRALADPAEAIERVLHLWKELNHS